jgi:hypothetical protein
VPLNPHALAVLKFLNGRFKNQKPLHYVVASERYSVCGDMAFDPTIPIKSLKEAWERAKKNAGILAGSTTFGRLSSS